MVWVDEYVQIPELLLALEAYVTRRGVFMSGAASDPSPLGQDRLNELSRALGGEIIRRGFDLVSGFGVGITEQSILGAYRAVYESQVSQPAERVLIRPFPGNTPAGQRAAAFTRHREEMISRVGAMVVVSGNKTDDDGTVIPSPGVDEEVKIALRLGKPVIPIGVSGHVARRIWEQAVAHPEQYLPSLKCDTELAILGDQNSSNEQLTEAVVGLLENAEKLASNKHRAA